MTYNGVNSKLEEDLPGSLASLSRRSAPLQARGGRLTFISASTPTIAPSGRASFDRLRKRGITTSWDFGWNEPLTNDRGLTGLIDALDFVFVNEHEARLYTGDRRRSRQRFRTGASERRSPSSRSAKPARCGSRPNRDIHVAAPKVEGRRHHRRRRCVQRRLPGGVDERQVAGAMPDGREQGRRRVDAEGGGI